MTQWKTTWLLVFLAATLFAFIFFVERRPKNTPGAGATSGRLIECSAADVTTIQLRRTNQLVLRAEKTNDTWNLTLPLDYPAQTFAIKGFLESLERLASDNYIPIDRATRGGHTLADYGLDLPTATLSLGHHGQRTEMLFGSKTPPGDNVYLQFIDKPGIYVIPAEFWDRLPRFATEWRDTALIPADHLLFERVEVRAPARGFALQGDPTNHLLTLVKPTPARASQPKVDAFLRAVMTARVTRFIDDNPRADLDQYGLQPPEAELAFSVGSNDIAVVQFGKSPTNDPSVVYARCLIHTNIVLTPRSVLDAILVSHGDMRDLHLLNFRPELVDQIEVFGPEDFVVRRQTSNTWIVGDTQSADPELVRDWLGLLARLEGNIEKDVVTDFAKPYRLAPPARRVVVKSSTTNSLGITTNLILGELDIGAIQGERIFSRRPDENSVYTINLRDFDLLPAAVWQLRDRRVWSFTTNQVLSVSVRQRGYTRTFLRNGNGVWSLGPDSQGVVNGAAVEEIIHRLGELRAAVWTDRGDANREKYGFSDEGLKIVITLKNGDKPRIASVEFGRFAPSEFPYALATLDGQSWVFEFPIPLFWLIQRDLTNPRRVPAAP